jgi:hypothetical protein
LYKKIKIEILFANIPIHILSIFKSQARPNMSSKNTVSMVCKVCQDAGKPETLFRSHFTRENRDPNSRVVCPTLLALECRFCHKNGHTVKYCPVLKGREKEEKQKQRAYIMDEPTPTKVTKKVTNNRFACFDSDEDEEVEVEVEVEVEDVDIEFPVLCQSIAPVKIQTGYAAALSKPRQEKPRQEQVKEEEKPVKIVVPVPRVAPWALNRTTKHSWADDTDSSDEED